MSQLAQAEIEQMRKIVAAADKKAPIKTLDLNNPPKAPYTHQEFPRLVYHPDYQAGHDLDGRPLSPKNSGHLVTANSQEDLDALLEKGFTIEPPKVVEPAEEEQEEAPAPATPVKRGGKKAKPAEEEQA
jgi:hypothetical protein